MGNKKRIIKRIKNLQEKQILKDYKVRVFKRHLLGLCFQLEKISRKRSLENRFPIGGFITSSDKKEVIVGKNLLEKTKNGQTKTVFDGSRDYKDDFGIQASASWIDEFKKMESKKIESKPSFLNFLLDKSTESKMV